MSTRLNIPPGYTELAFVHQHTETLKLAYCTVGYHSVVPADLEAMGNAWRDNMLAEMNSVWHFRQLRANDSGGLLFSVDYDAPGAGGGAGLVPNTSYLIKKGTGLSGRGNRGRMYLMGCDEPSVDEAGRVASGKLTGLVTEITAWLTAVDAIGNNMVLLHHNLVATPTVITSWTPEPVVATQRRRMAR